MDKIEELLTRGVDTIYPSREALEKVLRSGKKLRLYQGFDPSGTQLHIGHAVALRKLRQFQELGHRVIFLVGDFTGMIGDPTGKKEGRKRLSKKQVLENAKTYKEQAGKILRFDGENQVEMKFNSQWLSKLTFEDVLNLTGHFTVQQMIERDMFQERLKRHDDISLCEFLYPVMQGYDSVAMEVDLELGGTDQTFNMLAGRKLVSQMLQKEKFVMTVPLLTDSKGVKIGKTEGNVVGLTDPPNEFYAKVMSLGDDAIVPCFTLLTDVPTDIIESMKRDMQNQTANPMVFKKRLALELTKQLHDEKSAQVAQKEFEHVHQEGQIPHSHVAVYETKQREWDPIDLLTATKLAPSKSEAKRLIEQKAVELNASLITPPAGGSRLTLSDGDIIKVGKKKFLKVHII